MSPTSIAKRPSHVPTIAAIGLTGTGLLALLTVLGSDTRLAITAVAGMVLGVTLRMAWTAGAAERTDTAEHRQSPVASLTDLLAHCEDALVSTDASLRVVYANDAFAALCGRSIGDMRGKTILDALPPDLTKETDLARVLEELAADPDREETGELTRLAAPARSIEWRSVPLREADGIVRGRGFLFHDRSQARELAGLKSDFLSTVTHELRTPLTSVKGSLQLVLGKSAGLSAIDSELLHISLKNADRLIRLINDLLDISRLELGKIELTFGKVATGSLVDEAVAGLRAYAAAREISIDVTSAADVPALAGDRDRLIQVLTNLVSNAVKFSPAGASVEVTAGHQDGEVHIAVRDHGIGIPAADQCRLFQRFQRLHPGHSGEPGSGLGLAISKAIVDRHGGRILLDSREHEGSTFTVVLPALREPARTGEAPTHARASGEEPPVVLLIDDDAELGERLEHAWDGRYRLTRIARGIEALDASRRVHPDVVLLDVVLPDLSGYDVLRILRTTAATTTIPVIMLTVQPERALSANLGAVDVVAKPLDVAHLTRVVEQALMDRRVPDAARLAVG